MNGPGKKTRVLVCDDSRTYAAALTRLLEYGGTIEVVATVGDAAAAFEVLRREHLDLVLMDLELPGISGIEAVEMIVSTARLPVLVLSAHVGQGSDYAAAALDAGALDALAKRDLSVADPSSPVAVELRHRVRALSSAHTVERRRPQQIASAIRLPGRLRPSLIGICASSGGPQALTGLLSEIPATFPVPILVVQHMTPGFTEGLARHIDGRVPLPVRLGQDGVLPDRGVWIAADGADLTVGPTGLLRLDHSGDFRPNRPSGDALLTSLASHLGSAAAGVVLTGMGSDGAAGIRALRKVGALTIAQDEQSSAVFGMPRAAAEAGAEWILPLDQIAGMLCGLSARPT